MKKPKTIKKKIKKILKRPRKVFSIQSADEVPSDSDMPVTKGHFDAFRQEITARLTSFELLIKSNQKENSSQFTDINARFTAIDARFADIDARFAAIDARFADIDARFAAIDARFAAIDARFERLEKKIEDIYLEVRRTNLLVEEQINRNKLVMDALINLFNRQETLEKTVDTRIKNLEDIIKIGRA